MKKFFAAVVFALFVAVTSSASASSDIFAFSQDGIDFYVTENVGGDKLTYTNSVAGIVVGYKNNQPVGRTVWLFAYQPRPPHKVEVTVYDDKKNVLGSGFLDEDEAAQKVLAATLLKGKKG